MTLPVEATVYVWAQHRPQHDDLDLAVCEDATVTSACANRQTVRDLVHKHGLTAEIEAEARMIGLVIISTGMCHQGAA